MMMAIANDKVKVIITDNQKKVRIPTGLRMLVRRACIATLREEKFKGNSEVNVSFVDNNEIRRLNEKFRDKDSVTDVLSFPLGENGEYDSNPDTGAKLLGEKILEIELDKYDRLERQRRENLEEAKRISEVAAYQEPSAGLLTADEEQQEAE